jgi:hypothetical protein
LNIESHLRVAFLLSDYKDKDKYNKHITY